MNGYDEFLAFCDVNLNPEDHNGGDGVTNFKDPHCYFPLKNSIGKIVATVLYQNNTRLAKKHLAVGTMTHTSKYSMILIFEEILDSNNSTYFQYIGRITATNVGAVSFALDSLSIFDKYLIFTNRRTLYVVNIETFIKAPQWFTPTDVKQFELDPLMSQLSSRRFLDTYNIVGLNVIDHCEDYITLLVHTQKTGSLMLEIAKEAFKYDDWVSVTLPKKDEQGYSQDNHKNVLNSLRYKVNEDTEENILNNGKFLVNVYYYNYGKNTMVIADERVMVMLMLINEELDGLYNIYIIRIFNLITHDESIVYRDYAVQDTTL